MTIESLNRLMSMSYQKFYDSIFNTTLPKFLFFSIKLRASFTFSKVKVSAMRGLIRPCSHSSNASFTISLKEREKLVNKENVHTSSYMSQKTE